MNGRIHWWRRLRVTAPGAAQTEPAARPPRPPTVFGPDVVLVWDRALLVISERGSSGAPPAVLQIPVRSCTAARLAADPGLAGSELLQLTLTVRLGSAGLVQLPLWFPGSCRALLQALVDHVTAGARTVDGAVPPGSPRAAAPPIPLVEPLAVRRIPDTHEWIAFQAGDDGEVLRTSGADGTTADAERR